MESNISSNLLTKKFKEEKLTVVFAISSIILTIESLISEERFRGEYKNESLPEQVKLTFGNIQNLYKFLRANINEEGIVQVKTPGRVVVTYVYDDDGEIQSKPLTFNLEKRKSEIKESKIEVLGEEKSLVKKEESNTFIYNLGKENDSLV